MALTPEEQAELAEIENELVSRQQEAQPAQQPQGLTPEEEAELLAIENELGVRQQEDQFSQTMEAQQQEQNGALRATRVGLERAGTLGTRPLVAGIGAGAGQFVGALQRGAGIGEAFGEAGDAFTSGRQEAIQEQQQLAQEYPKASLAGEAIGTIATAPLLAAKGVMGAAKIGGLYGAGQAVGESESVNDAVEKIVAGTVFGGASGVAGKVLGSTIKTGVGNIKKLFPKKAALRLAEATTGIPSQQIEKFARDTKRVDRLIKSVGGEFQEATDLARQKIRDDIFKFRQKMGEQIGGAISQLDEKIAQEYGSPKFYSAKKIINSFDDTLKTIDERLYPDDITQIKELKDVVLKVAGDSGKLSAKELHGIKEFLQDRAKGSYQKAGQLFSSGKKAQRAAKAAAAQTRKNLNEILPEVRVANNKLATLHGLEDKMNKGILKELAPEATFISAGTGLNPRNEKALKLLGEITDTNPLDMARELAAAKQFTSPSLLSAEGTGKTLTRLVVGAGVGGAIGTVTGDAQTGAAIGAALSSPASLKALIKSGDLTSDAIKASIKALTNPSVQSIVSREAAKQGIDIIRIRKRMKNALKGVK